MAIRTPSGGRDIPASNRPTTARFDTAADAIATKTSRAERLDPIDRRREVGEEHHRVAVAVVGRQPRDRPGALRGPLDEEARLAVAGRRHDRDHGAVPAGPEQAQEPRAAQRHRLPARDGELRLDERVRADGRARLARGVSLLGPGRDVGDLGGGHVLAGGARIAAEAVRRAASLTGDHFAVDRRSRRLPRLALLGCRSPRGILPPARRMRLTATRPRVGVAQVDSPGR